MKYTQQQKTYKFKRGGLSKCIPVTRTNKLVQTEGGQTGL